MPTAIVLLSGGLDSATTLAVAEADGFDIAAISFRYGQRHSAEVDAANRIAAAQKVKHHTIVDIDLRIFGESSLTAEIEVPENRTREEMSSGIPDTYVPARNTIFLSYAIALAEVQNAFDIYIGVNALDFGGYPDCRPEYVTAFERMANLATASNVESGGKLRIHAPLIEMTKEDIVGLGLKLGVDFGMTVSCYQADSDGVACGRCDACQLRLQGFEACGVVDPARYREPAAVKS